MPAPYSIDLRLRVIAACKRGVFTELEVAETFGIGEATVRRWKRRERESGSVEPLPHGGGGTVKSRFVCSLTAAWISPAGQAAFA